MEKLYKFYSYTRKNGIGGALKKTYRYAAKKTNIVKQPIDIMASVDDVIAADFVAYPYVKPAPIKKEIYSIGWVLSPISAGSGGHNTISRFARYLAQQGHEVTFYIYEAIQPQSVAEAKRILEEHFNLYVAVKKIGDYVESDVVIATGWETAYPVFNLKTKAHKFYFVQDFEPLFYGLGTKAVLAQNTYKMNFFGITAGRWLSSKLSKEFGMSTDHFDFGVDLNVYKATQTVIKTRKVVFYARPVTERRAFELGVLALDIFHKKHPEYTIEFIGWDTSNYQVPFPYINRGIINHAELAELYQEADACMVLSLTNVSLLPLEVLAAGCIPVMNEGDNNSMVLGKNDYIHYAEPIPMQLADAMSNEVERNNKAEYAKAASNSVDNLSWDTSYAKVEAIIKREVAGK